VYQDNVLVATVAALAV